MQVFLKGNPTVNAFIASLLVFTTLVAIFSMFEPLTTYGAASTFTVDQEITSELSFLTPPGDVAMSGGIAGLSGGNAYGTTTFNISTNNANGYKVDISFSTSTAMHATGSSSVIPNYSPTAGAGNADYNFTYTTGQAYFGYTVQNATTPTDIDPTFKDNGSNACGGSGTQVGKCWYNKADATVAETIINSSSPTSGTGATSSVTFRVAVGANPVPALQEGWYRATATLTATVNP